MLDPIHNQGLRLALGAFRTSPVASLYVEADEPSLYSRREKLSLQYAIRLAANFYLFSSHYFCPENIVLIRFFYVPINSFSVMLG